MDLSNLKAYLYHFKNKQPEGISVVISHYNQTKSINLVLQAIEFQTVQPQEVIIADDGSVAESRDHLETLVDNSPLPLKFINQEDQGFRKEKILNEAVLEYTTGQLIIFLDGDTIPNPQLIESYRDLYQPFSYLVGWRFNVPLKESKAWYKNSITPEKLKKFVSWKDQIELTKRSLKQRFYAFLAYWFGKSDRPFMYGANWAVDRGLFFGVNGFDESYINSKNGDSDIRNRINFYGGKPIIDCYGALAFHLDHELDQVHRDSSSEKNKSMEDYSKSKFRMWPKKGLFSETR